jgi:hypothetical protein
MIGADRLRFFGETEQGDERVADRGQRGGSALELAVGVGHGDDTCEVGLRKSRGLRKRCNPFAVARFTDPVNFFRRV